jgi:hypothetical protein
MYIFESSDEIDNQTRNYIFNILVAYQDVRKPHAFVRIRIRFIRTDYNSVGFRI